ncbi:MAG: flagellar export chaperone FliS [Deferribacteraceae bacterium]|jgi:flagellar protein FliS|nr:flagellar export chaperone FliS [Deferribacteraceae bacterium]
MSVEKVYGNYLKQEVEGASQGKLIVMMYDAAIRFMRSAVKAIEEKKVEDAHNNIIRAENIIYELMSTLNTDEGGELAQNLLNLYDFMIWELVDANTNKNAAKIENVIKVIMPIRSAWKEIAARGETPQAQDTKKTDELKPLNVAG